MQIVNDDHCLLENLSTFRGDKSNDMVVHDFPFLVPDYFNDKKLEASVTKFLLL